MIAGHFGFAALVKARERRTPLWALMLACQWLDVVFIPLFATGVERIVPVAGSAGGYGEGVIYADYTHSLLGALGLSLAFGAVAARRWGRRSGGVLGAVAFSHWLLDLVVHRRDLPLLPGNAGQLPRLGFSLWRFPRAAIAVELVLVLAGSILYWRAARKTGGRAAPAGALMLASGIVTLALNAAGW